MSVIDETRAHHVEAVARGAKCRQCPLYDCGQGPVMPRIRPGALVTIIGESPSNGEVETGRIFDGAPGEVIFDALKEGGIAADQTSVTSAILCRPPGGHMLDYELTLKATHKREVTAAKKQKRDPAPLITPQMCCAPRLQRDIEDSGAKTLLALGSEGLKATAHAAKIPFATKGAPGQPRVAALKKQHGSPVPLSDGRVITSAMHPAFVMYGNSKFLPVVREDIKRAARIALRGGLIDWREPEFILKPSIDTCINVLSAMKRSGQLITVDIETDGIDVQVTKIRCIGLGATIDGQELIIVVPLRHMDGRSWWSHADESRLLAALTDLLEVNPLSGHNLAFDTAVMLQHRILINRARKWVDTMLGHHNTSQSELPHDLGFVAARKFEAPRWKDDADHKNVEGVDDYWLHLYCAKDVLGEMRLVAPIAMQIAEEGFIHTFQVDTKLAPVARDMGDLGLNINESRRRLYFNILDTAVNERIAELRAITGLVDFNPNASKQVSKFLYVTKGLSPPYATDGREWSELSDEDEELPLDTDDPEVILAEAATNELSLLRLLELGVDDHTRRFIETQLSFRGLAKCRSTQMGLKWEEKDGQMVLTDVHRKKGRIHTENRGEFKGMSILHPNWKLHVVRTGRWAVNPNVQAWPERIVWNIALYQAWLAKKLKTFNPDGSDGIINTRAIVEAPDERWGGEEYIIVGADYMAVELRIYAIMAQDELLLDAIYNGKDPHALNFATMQARHPAEVMTWYEKVKNSPDQVKKNFRNIAKRFFFLCVYNGQEDTLFKTMSADREPDGRLSFPGLKPEYTKMWFANLHRGHPEMKRWHAQCARAWTTHGFVSTIIDGRRCYFLGGMDEQAIPNHTIQGSAASIANRAMITVAEHCPHRGWGAMAGPILQVHDYIGLQAPVRRQKEAEELLDFAMPYEHKGMRFEIERKSGKRWDQT